MALIDPSQTKRLEIPHEPGSWVEVRSLMAGDAMGLEVHVGSIVAMTLETMASVIVAWSYDEPPSIETVKRLDYDTFLWLNREALFLSGVRDEPQKKDLNGNSSPISDPVEEPSLVSSGIS